MIEGIVNDKEAVVKTAVVFLDFYSPSILLLIQLLQMEKRCTNVFCIYGCIYILFSLF